MKKLLLTIGLAVLVTVGAKAQSTTFYFNGPFAGTSFQGNLIGTSTNFAAITVGANGVTNTTAFDIILDGFTNTTAYITNITVTGAGYSLRGAINTPYDIILKPNEAIIGTGCQVSGARIF